MWLEAPPTFVLFCIFCLTAVALRSFILTEVSFVVPFVEYLLPHNRTIYA